MARTRAADNPRHAPKKITVEDIANGTARLQEVLTAINDFSQEGFPYRDAARAKAELQLRECVKQVFGERSPEFHTYRHCTLRTSNGAETAQSIAAVKHLLLILDEKKLELQGFKPLPATPEYSGTGKVSPMSTAQMRLVPPASSTTMATKPTQGTAPDSGAATMMTSLPPGSTATAGRPTSMASAPRPPISTQSVPRMPVPPTATGQFPKPQAPQPPAFSPDPVAMTPPAPAVTAPLPVPAPPPVAPPTPSVSITHETIPAPTQRVTPERAAPSSETSTQPVAVQTAQTAPVAQPLSESETLHLIRKVCLRFHAVARQLRLRTDSRPTIEIEDDRDLGDLLRALLRLEFDEVGTDEWTPPYSGGTPKTTLLLNRERIAIVTKKTRPGLTDKDIAEQVTADTGSYLSHNKCTTLFCFVYDPEGRIGSPKRLETDLSNVSDRYTVEVLVAPK
jgi:hypothetical protein